MSSGLQLYIECEHGDCDSRQLLVGQQTPREWLAIDGKTYCPAHRDVHLVARRAGTYHPVSELEPGDQIVVGVNGDLARVIGGMAMKLDDGNYEDWVTLSVPKDALFRLGSPS